MLFDKSRLKYFLILSQIIIIIVSVNKIINAQNETYWILTIVLSSLIFIFIFSVFEQKEIIELSSPIDNKIREGSELEFNHSNNEKIPDVLEEGWDLPL